MKTSTDRHLDIPAGFQCFSAILHHTSQKIYVLTYPSIGDILIMINDK